MEEHALWVEKYRPKSFTEVKGQIPIIQKIKAFVTAKNMPHMMFAGPAGVGKSTTALVVARELFGESWRDNFLELNASDERGIDVVRTKVKDFARTKSIGNVPFKIIFLDECLGYNSLIQVSSEEGIKTIKIGELVEKEDIYKYFVLSVNDSGEKVFVPITSVMKIPHNKEEGFYSLTIHNKKIEITGNHLIITPYGWTQVKNLVCGSLVLCPLEEKKIENPIIEELVCYQLVGLPQEIRKKERYIAKSPEKAIIEILACSKEGLKREEITKKSKISSSKLSSILGETKNEYYLSLPYHHIVKKCGNRFKLEKEKNCALQEIYKIKREQNSNNQEYVTKSLEQLSLYPLKRENAYIVARLVGHLFGDGSLSLKAKQLFFSGKEEDMKKIRGDINKLGFYTLGNIRRNVWKNGECWSIISSGITLLSLFYSLGVPVGKKTDTPYLIPSWIMNGDTIIKKEFLSSFFGSEGDKPAFQGRTVKAIRIAQSKRIDLKDNLMEFLNQMQILLNEFGIDNKIKISTKIKNIRKDGTESIEGMIWITNARKNIITFLENIGYTYCDYKEDIAKKTLQYLKWKESLGKGVYSFKPVPYFEEWQNKYMLRDCAYSYVTDIQKIPEPEYVYCIATENKKFIANDIIVHNCDALTKEAQQALRRTMENYTQTTRFILSCNYSSKIIDPIQSRCTVFRFKPLEKEEMFAIFEKIAEEEGIRIDAKAKDALHICSDGDCRKAENILQSCVAVTKNVTEDDIFSLASVAKPKEINEFLNLALQNKFVASRDKLLETMLKYGLSGLDIIKQIQKEVWNLPVSDQQKVMLVDKCGEIEFRMTEGADEFVQLEALLAQFTLCKK